MSEFVDNKAVDRENPDKVGEERVRKTLRFYKSDLNRAEYWADKLGVSINDFMMDAAEAYIAIKNGDYEIPTLEAQRLNQMIDAVTALMRQNDASMSAITSSLDALLRLTRGDNYLLEQDAEA